jgi:(p)ppGpp synthase/HD superfamily hydrolase
MTLIDEAASFAEQAHEATGQQRKYTGEPYFIHPRRVALRLENLLTPLLGTHELSWPYYEAIIAAAYLHDVVEDCNVSISTIKEKFGSIVAQHVAWLTSDKTAISYILTDKNINNYEAKGIYLAYKMNRMSLHTRLIKWADREDNVRDLANLPPEESDFASNYAKETKYIIEHLAFVPTPIEAILIASITGMLEPFSTDELRTSDGSSVEME